MKEMIFTSSKFYKVSLFLVFVVLIYSISKYLIKPDSLEVNVECKNIEVSNSSCKFTCELFAHCDGKIKIRYVALHSGWAAIEDKMIDGECNEKNAFSLEFPKRDYNYMLRVGIFNEEYGISEKVLYC